MSVFDLNYPRAWTPNVFVEEDRWKELRGLPPQLHRHFEPMLFIRLKQSKCASLSSAREYLPTINAESGKQRKGPSAVQSERSFTREKREPAKNLSIKGRAPSKSSKVYTIRSDLRRESISLIGEDAAASLQSMKDPQRPRTVQGLVRQRPASATRTAVRCPRPQTPIKFGVWEVEVSQGLSTSFASKTRKNSLLTWFPGRQISDSNEHTSSGLEWSDAWSARSTSNSPLKSQMGTARYSDKRKFNPNRENRGHRSYISSDDVDSLFITRQFLPSSSPTKSARFGASRKSSRVFTSSRPGSVGSVRSSSAVVDGLQPWSDEARHSASPPLGSPGPGAPTAAPAVSRSGSSRSVRVLTRQESSASALDNQTPKSPTHDVIPPLFNVKVSRGKKKNGTAKAAVATANK